VSLEVDKIIQEEEAQQSPTNTTLPVSHVSTRATFRRKAVARTSPYTAQPIPTKKTNESVRCKLQGIILKESHNSTVSVKRWKPRWVSIVDNVIYSTENVVSNGILTMLAPTTGEPDGTMSRIYGASILSVRESGHETNGYVFEITTIKNVSRWCCDTEVDMRKWTQAVQEVMVRSLFIY
jgi:hypothetical protein